MRCPSLTELPTPPFGKSGWPWTEETPHLPDSTSDGRSWPQISLVTPSYNQGEYIEETIRSVLLQGYPNLEYIIIDGGSNDNSLEIIKKYEPWLTYWISEPDHGQSHAINKGLRKATGEFAAYQNSDDIYWPNAMKTIGQILGGGGVDALFASADILDIESRRHPTVCKIAEPRINILIRFWKGPSNILPSQGFFCRLDLLRSLGLFDENYHYKMDFDLFCRMLEVTPIGKIRRLDEVMAGYRIYEGSKTGLMSSRKAVEEGLEISQRYWHRLPGETPMDLAREARHALGFIAMCRANVAAEKNRRWQAIRELMLALGKSPRIGMLRWSMKILRRIGRSFFLVENRLK